MSKALEIWREKLEALRVDEALATGGPERFALKKHIEEAEAMIAKLQREAAPPPPAPPTHDITRIVGYAPEELIGRERELKLLDDAWTAAINGEKDRPHVLTLVALGGEGKTSLAAHWALALQQHGWPACDRAFAWSFYSQGTRDQVAASSDAFVKEALIFFGDPATAGSPQSAFDKGRRLAQLVSEGKSLLILDGLEPLQYAPTPAMESKLKDEGMAALLKGLAGENPGLCVVTTRYSVPDLKGYRATTAPEHQLPRLSKEAGVDLLRKLGVRGALGELQSLVEDVKGHALTLNLLGSYLHHAHGGDVRRRDLVRLQDADDEEQGGHAFRVMDAYVRWFEGIGAPGKRAISLLTLIGLFDRPATEGCVSALLKPPAIPDLTEALAGTIEANLNLALTRLESARLITVERAGAGTLVSLDAHPLLREYFAKELREKRPEAWRSGHRLLYEHLCGSVEHRPDTLEGLQPLYQAVHHGCQAGMQMEACVKVYQDRILRGNEVYSTNKLGAYGSDLGAVACFFDLPWKEVSPALSDADRSWMLNDAAFTLRGLGRSSEAMGPMRAGLEMYVQMEHWEYAARVASNLSELALSQGEGKEAVEIALRGVEYADRNGDWFQRMARRATHADALHQTGRREEAQELFREAEAMQGENHQHPLLYSLQGFLYCDLLLSPVERTTWRMALGLSPASSEEGDGLLSTYRDASHRAEQALRVAEEHGLSLLTIALDRLTLARVARYEAVLKKEDPKSPLAPFDAAVDALRKAGSQHHLPSGLLSRAWHHALSGDSSEAKRDLDEAWEIAERGPMVLHLIDVLLHRARLFRNQSPYPWEGSAKEDLKEARRLIEKHGYWRRKEELEDAEAVIK
ncbi:MAG: hypothetical protein ACO1SV_09435 [Fimbriimonas sp.]